MENIFNNIKIEPYLYSCDSIITEVNKEFIDFTGFTMDELLGKSLIEIGDMLKITSQIRLDNIKSKYSGYIFTKFLEAREVNISLFHDNETNEKVYTFIEKPNSRKNKIIQHQNEQLKQQNAQLISIIENLSEGVILANNKGEFIMVNSEAKKLIYQCDKIIDIGDTHKRSRAFDLKGNQIPFENFPQTRALRGERVKNDKISIRHPNKEYFLEASAIPIYNTNGDLTMVVSCFHDITETIEQSRKIEEQKKELEAIIENIADGISIFDDKGQYMLFNKSEREMFSPYYEHMVKTSDWYKQCELYDIDGEKISSENTPSARVMRGESLKNIRMSVKLPHKTLQIEVSGTPIYDSEGKFILGVICDRDITDDYKHEEAIKYQFEILNRVIDTFDLPVVRLSCQDLKIVDINKKAFGIIKLLFPNVKTIENLKYKKIEDFFETFKTSDYYQCISDALKEKKAKHLNKKNYWVDGNEVYWNVIFEPVLEVNGEIQEILILIIDVTTEIKSTLGTEKALKLQGEFLVNISHELKTPLNVICATAQLFDMYIKNGSFDEKKESIIKYIESIKQNSYRLSKIINNIVDLSKIEAGFFKLNLSNNNIVDVVEEIVMSVTNFTDSKGLNIIFDTDIEENIIACDTEKIERIVLNLISNAIKFSDEGDEIVVDVKNKNEFVEISVSDNGIGIEEKNIDMIFDRFKQIDKSLSRNKEGTGIGLSLVKSIVELHGGSISVESEFGKGSKFIVMLPSRKVLNENMIYSSNVPSTNQSIRVEFSDVCS